MFSSPNCSLKMYHSSSFSPVTSWQRRNWRLKKINKKIKKNICTFFPQWRVGREGIGDQAWHHEEKQESKIHNYRKIFFFNCTLYIVNCTLYTVHGTLYIVQPNMSVNLKVITKKRREARFTVIFLASSF